VDATLPDIKVVQRTGYHDLPPTLGKKYLCDVLHSQLTKRLPLRSCLKLTTQRKLSLKSCLKLMPQSMEVQPADVAHNSSNFKNLVGQ